jgi:hypothetical protein
MWNRLKKFFESLVYAGLKPQGLKPEPRSGRWGLLRDKIESFLSGGRPPSDPLYLSNRTWRQKLKLGIVFAIPTALLLGALVLVFTNVYTPEAAPPKEASAKEILAKLFPDLEKTVQIDTYTDAEFVQLTVRRDGPKALTGLLRNKTDHVISVEFEADLANLRGARVGSVTERVEKVPPRASVPFEFPINNSPDAAMALLHHARTVP